MISIGLLPYTMQPVAREIGIEATLQFCGRYGGTFISLPSEGRLSEDHHLSVLLGYETARRVCRLLGGQSLDVPRAEMAQRALMVSRVKADYQNGASVNDLARKYETSRQTIGRMLKETGGNAQAAEQLGLFEGDEA